MPFTKEFKIGIRKVSNREVKVFIEKQANGGYSIFSRRWFLLCSRHDSNVWPTD